MPRQRRRDRRHADGARGRSCAPATRSSSSTTRRATARPDVVRAARAAARPSSKARRTSASPVAVTSACARSRAPLVLLLNPDAVPAPGCLDALRACAAERPEWGAWQALVTMADGELVNTAGNVVHYLGFGWAGDLGRPVADVDPRPREVGFCSGAALVVRREAWDAVGRLRRALLHVRRGPRPLAAPAAGGLGRRASCRRRGSPTTTSSPRATTSGSTSSATAGGRSSAPIRRALLALLAPGAAGLRGRAPAGGVARRLAAARSCARRRAVLRGLPAIAAPPPRRAGHAADRRRRPSPRRSRRRWTRRTSRAPRVSPGSGRCSDGTGAPSGRRSGSACTSDSTSSSWFPARRAAARRTRAS